MEESIRREVLEELETELRCARYNRDHREVEHLESLIQQLEKQNRESND